MSSGSSSGLGLGSGLVSARFSPLSLLSLLGLLSGTSRAHRAGPPRCAAARVTASTPLSSQTVDSLLAIDVL